MPRAKLLSGRGVMENHLPSVLGKKRRFYVESWGGVLTTIKHQSKTEPRSPPALVVARAMPRADRLSGRGSIGHSHPTHLKEKTRFLFQVCLPYPAMARAVDGAQRGPLSCRDAEGASTTRGGGPNALSPAPLGRARHKCRAHHLRRRFLSICCTVR